MKTKSIIMAALIALMISAPAYAARYAVLFGVSNYADPAYHLDGPDNDLAALRQTLITNYGFDQKSITVLDDKKATKKGIIDELRKLRTRTKPGDYIFVYFSGHGTSPRDEDAKLGVMGTNTGAIVPYDFKVGDTAEQTIDRLIVGRRDLRPIFEELDRDRQLFVVFDSCFSGQSVRSLTHGKERYLPLSLPKSSSGGFSGTEKEAYPYKRLLYISAADDNEKAVDLRGQDGTFDGKAHGNLSNFLILGLKGGADTNGDGEISYQELYAFCRNGVTSKATHTPQLLYAESASGELGGQVFRSMPLAVEHTARPAALPMFNTNGPLTVKYNGGAVKSVAGTVAAREGDDFDIEVRATGGGYEAYLKNGDRLASFESAAETTGAVGRYVTAKELIRLSPARQSFNVWLNPEAYDGKTVFKEGDPVGFKVQSEKDATLLLLDIDPEGYISVILPGDVMINRVKGGQKVLMSGIGNVAPPFGTEILKLFAFPTSPKGLDGFRTSEPLSDGQAAALIKLIKAQQGWSSAIISLFSSPR